MPPRRRVDRRFFRDAWELTKPYWSSSPERWSARLLLAGIIALNLFQVYLQVWLNEWRGLFFDALQEYNEPVFVRQLIRFSIWAVIAIATSLLTYYLTQMLQIRWRRWMTGRYIRSWLDHKAYYRMQLIGSAADNPDQRIADDLRIFTTQVLSLSIGLLSSVVTFFSFFLILWNLSGPLTIPLGALGIGLTSITIPGYAAVGAILYAGIGTWLTVKIGRPLVSLLFNQQRYEADFRYSLVRLRENSESIAFYSGEPQEDAVLTLRFSRVFGNFLAVLRRQMQLIIMNSGYSQIAIIVPYIVAAPKYFGKAIEFGGIQQIATAFDQVQSSLSFVVNSYSDIAELQAVMSRLTEFQHRAAEVRKAAEEPTIALDTADQPGLAVQELDLALPDGTLLRQNINLDVPPGGHLLVMGPSGAGKSTLLRAISGLWPFGKGRIASGAKRPLFLPQRPYIPLGTLRQAILYPYDPADVTDADIKSALETVGLAALFDELEHEDIWAQRLSIGEQQRLAFARILVQRPDMIFMDEATSALDEATEERLYKVVEEMTPRPTILSVGHRSTLKALHDGVFDLGPPLTGASATGAAAAGA
ncbi:MAG TPA: ABC transporter ATP-binding protein/permease [Stellaceae bacterium]|nr:ABC transporter ATP-binding protein/permease [Stellaceae bacterium]